MVIQAIFFAIVFRIVATEKVRDAIPVRFQARFLILICAVALSSPVVCLVHLWPTNIAISLYLACSAVVVFTLSVYVVDLLGDVPRPQLRLLSGLYLAVMYSPCWLGLLLKGAQ